MEGGPGYHQPRGVRRYKQYKYLQAEGEDAEQDVDGEVGRAGEQGASIRGGSGRRSCGGSGRGSCVGRGGGRPDAEPPVLQNLAASLRRDEGRYRQREQEQRSPGPQICLVPPGLPREMAVVARRGDSGCLGFRDPFASTSI